MWTRTVLMLYEIPQFMRITILGLPGSGKSTLARKIADKFHVPYIHIDRFWLESGGGHNSSTTSNPEETHAQVRTKVLEAIQLESWVSDGVYPLIQVEIVKLAETIIFLDIPLWQRLWNHTKRTIRSVGRHDEMTFWNNIQFFLEMISADLNNRSKILNFLNGFQRRAITLQSEKEINEYLRTLG
jgi:adenylate kinase family enzyme